MQENDGKFTYNYTAPTESERREIEDIRRRYGEDVRAEDKLAKLRGLDKRVKNPPMIIAVLVCVASVLVFGFGLTLVLEWGHIAFGVPVMIVGIAGIVAVKPLHTALLKRNKRKYGADILRLSKELLNE